MEMAATLHASMKGRRAAPWIGCALLALWLGWLVPAFRVLLAPTGRPEQAGAIVARLQATTPAARGLRHATLFLAGPGDCHCRPAPTPAELRDALHRAGTAVELRPAGAATGYPVVVLAPPARLVYAGPARVDGGCGRAIPLARLLPALLSASRQALIVPSSSCQCSKEP